MRPAMECEEKSIERREEELKALRSKVSSLRKENARLKRGLECTSAGILKAVCAVSEQFFHSTPQDEKSIRDLVAPIGEAAMISRISIYENTLGVDGELLTNKQYEWTAPDITPAHDEPKLQVYSWKDRSLRRWRHLLSQGSIIYGLVKDLPPEERNALGLHDTVSVAVLPIFSGKRWWGFISFEEIRGKREWSPTEVDALKTAADILGVLIYRKQMLDERKESERTFRNLSEEISDVDRYALEFNNHV